MQGWRRRDHSFLYPALASNYISLYQLQKVPASTGSTFQVVFSTPGTSLIMFSEAWVPVPRSHILMPLRHQHQPSNSSLRKSGSQLHGAPPLSFHVLETLTFFLCFYSPRTGCSFFHLLSLYYLSVPLLLF